MNYSSIVFFDLEMCCWDDGRKPSIGEIIEIGIAELDFIKGIIVRRAQYFVIPEQDEISNYCTALTGITHKIVKDRGRPLKDVVNSISKKFGGKKKSYSGWGRDDIILKNECLSKGIDSPIHEFINLSAIYNIKNRNGSKRASLSDALRNHNLSFIGRQHSAYDDALNLAKIGQIYL